MSLTPNELVLIFIGGLLAAVNALLLWQLNRGTKSLDAVIALIGDLRVGQAKLVSTLDHMYEDVKRHDENIRDLYKLHREITSKVPQA